LPVADESDTEAAVAKALLAQAETGLLALDGDLRVVLANRAAASLFGFGECCPGDPIARVVESAAELKESAVASLQAWFRDPAPQQTIVHRTDGKSLDCRCAAGPAGHFLVSVTLASASAAPDARRDALTGLPDRAWFFERLSATLGEPGADPAVMMIDLDRFKAVNDTLGHPMGDAVLQIVAKRLRSTLREGDMVCRIAGDEFAVLLRRPSDPDAVARRIVTALSRPYLIEGATASIGASVGIALAPEHGTDPHALIRSADVALYAAKDGGRGGTCVFTADLDRTARERHAMIEALRHAVVENQLELHYQPQVAIDTGQLTGFEALVRWHHPEHGLLLPGQFIPLAEDTGLIWPIADWVLRTACEEAISWPMHLSVAVNISPKQLLDRNRLARTVKRMLLKSGLAPHRLELEITETALMREAETLPVLLDIRDTGVRISLDDFGTGCSSLGQLRRYPFDKLKIDRSFIHALGSSLEATDLVRAIASLGRSLGITTIAEGVETEEQQRRLLVEGCVEMQGFLLSRPVPAQELGRLISALRRKESGPHLAA
jgi:diguanylate cyclase (GGDEF)-like protein